jgi:tetratricopeptide (TPR) repeat protein
MSLLIKALDKAESDKVEHASSKQKQAEKNKAKTESPSDLELSLGPADSVLTESAPVAKASDVSTQSAIQTSSQTTSQPSKSATAPLNTSTSSNSPKSAANVFSAKGVEATNQNTRLALIGGAGLVLLLGMGLYFYQFVDNTPDVVIPSRSLAQAQEQAPERLTEPLQESTLSETTVAEAPMPQVFEPDEPTQLAENQNIAAKKLAKKQAASEDKELAVDENETVLEEAIVDETVVVTKANKKSSKLKNLQFGEAIASRSASIEVTKTQPASGINPTLMSAYEAYNAGDDAKAQKLYKQVLQNDLRNVDALLGLGAIASRQGRMADANGWFGKVLEIDPRNNMAQAALIDNQPQGNEANSESRIKNMLAKNPSDANLHVALGNLYAEQNQWPAAQQAYFDAYSLNGSADNAFNLAVSLDQMGKPKLALPYYQRALAQASSTSSIDKAALEARIAAIQ